MSTASSTSTITGIAVLDNPRALPGQKDNTILFDALICLGPGCPEGLTACLRYYNKTETTFEETNKCFFVATITAYDPRAYRDIKYEGSNMKSGDYELMGEILYLIMLPPEERVEAAPFFQLAGIAGDRDDQAKSFGLDIRQYTHFLGSNSCLPFTVEAPKTMKNPTLPKNGTIVSTWGPLLEVIKPPLGTAERDASSVPERLRIEFDTVQFLGHAPLPPRARSVPKKTGPMSLSDESPSKKFKNGFGAASRSPSKSSTPIGRAGSSSSVASSAFEGDVDDARGTLNGNGKRVRNE